MIRVAVVDDHPVFRDGLAGLLRSEPGLHLAVTAADADDLFAALAGADVPVDVVLMDINLPGLSGVEATERLMSAPQPPAVLMVTMVDDDDTVVAALAAGARGYVLKGATGDEIVAAVRTVAAGGAVFGSGLAARVLARTATPVPEAADPHQNGLTEREQSVLALVADGLSNAQIARRLGLSVKTVQNYVSRILDKLQLADRTQAALHARSRRSGT